MGQKQASSLLVRLLLRSFWSNSVCSLVKGLGSLVARFSSVAEAKSAQLSLSGIGFYGFRLTGYLCIFQHVSLVRPGLAQWLPHGLPILCCWESCIFEGCEPRADPSVVGDSWLPTITFFFCSPHGRGSHHSASDFIWSLFKSSKSLRSSCSPIFSDTERYLQSISIYGFQTCLAINVM